MTDKMVLATQQWLNRTYAKDSRFGRVREDGKTGWDTVNALIRGLQIELGVSQLANNFGPTTRKLFVSRYPTGIVMQQRGDKSTANVYNIIQGALWCKGYYGSGSGELTGHYYRDTADAIQTLREDIGIEKGSVVDEELMPVLLSMDQFKLLKAYGAKPALRSAQRSINRMYRRYTGIIPTDGLYGRSMNTALIKILQALEGYTPEQATGYFGDGTRAKLKIINEEKGQEWPYWVWLAQVALVCNGYLKSASLRWESDTRSAVEKFQKDYALPVSGVIDPTTWMSLLTSKGDPKRSCVACDTRFEMTEERLKTLKDDGYSIVGRYLTEPNQENLDASDYFKAIRPGELERILKHGMKFFPIFQEYSTKLSHFSVENGIEHGHRARKTAQKLGIPPTHIYFAVDFDATDEQVTSHIIPYFEAVHGSLGGGYKVGIYASRNICTRVIDSGHAGRAFVSDMSTGFSGNLGFPIPEGWVYDQFDEISNYKGQGWDLDRVAFSGLEEAVSYTVTPRVRHELIGGEKYNLMDCIELIYRLEKRFSELRNEGKVGGDNILPNWRYILNYLAKDYLDGSFAWRISAEGFKKEVAVVLESDPVSAQIIKYLDLYIGRWRQPFVDADGENIDLAHLSATILGYLSDSVIPHVWTGWAGDLATAIGEIDRVMRWNPGVNLKDVCESLVGRDEHYRDNLLSKLVTYKDGHAIGNPCSRNDLVCDNDAIYFAEQLKRVSYNNSPHILSTILRSWYARRGLGNRLKYIRRSLGGSDFKSLTDNIYKIYSDEAGRQMVYSLMCSYPLCTNISDKIFYSAAESMAERLIAVE